MGGKHWVTEASLVARNETRSLSKQTRGELATKSEGGSKAATATGENGWLMERQHLKRSVSRFEKCRVSIFAFTWPKRKAEGASKSSLVAFFLSAIQDHLSRVLIFNFQLLENFFAANGSGSFHLSVWGFIEKGWSYLQADFN